MENFRVCSYISLKFKKKNRKQKQEEQLVKHVDDTVPCAVIFRQLG